MVDSEVREIEHDGVGSVPAHQLLDIAKRTGWFVWDPIDGRVVREGVVVWSEEPHVMRVPGPAVTPGMIRAYCGSVRNCLALRWLHGRILSGGDLVLMVVELYSHERGLRAILTGQRRGQACVLDLESGLEYGCDVRGRAV